LACQNRENFVKTAVVGLVSDAGPFVFLSQTKRLLLSLHALDEMETVGRNERYHPALFNEIMRDSRRYTTR